MSLKNLTRSVVALALIVALTATGCERKPRTYAGISEPAEKNEAPVNPHAKYE